MVILKPQDLGDKLKFLCMCVCVCVCVHLLGEFGERNRFVKACLPSNVSVHMIRIKLVLMPVQMTQMHPSAPKCTQMQKQDPSN